MAAFRFSRTEGSQVDPFNAGEPELPGGKPDALAGADEPEGQVEYAAHGEPGGTPHKPEDDYQAPNTRGHDYDAPSIDEPRRPRRTRARRSPAPSGEVQERTVRDRRVVTRVIVLIVLLLSFGSSLASCAIGLVGSAADGIGSAMEGLGAIFFEDDSYDGDDYVPEQDADDESAVAALEARLAELLADPASGELHDRVAAYLDEKMLTIEGYTAAELGLDADELATYVLEGTHAEASYAYAFDDGTASAYAEVTARSANELFWTLNDAFGEYLLDNDLWGRDARMPDAAQREHIAAAAEQALGSPAEPETYTYTFLLERVDGAWAVDEDGLDETLESILGLY